MKIISTNFLEGERIPVKYTCQGESITPPLFFLELPENTQSLALILDDPDAPGGTFTHWLIWNINSLDNRILENQVPEGAVEGKNSSGSIGYLAPCPPSGTHRYIFKAYALDTNINLKKGATKGELEPQINKHKLDEAQLMVNFSV